MLSNSKFSKDLPALFLPDPVRKVHSLAYFALLEFLTRDLIFRRFHKPPNDLAMKIQRRTSSCYLVLVGSNHLASTAHKPAS